MRFDIIRDRLRHSTKLKLKIFNRTAEFNILRKNRYKEISSEYEKLQKYSSILVLSHLNNKSCVFLLKGGLGNQMFGHAFAKAVEKERGLKPIYDLTYYIDYIISSYQLQKYGINVETTNIDYGALLEEDYKCVEDIFGVYSPEFITSSAVYYEGYFQSEKYFKKYRDELIEDFKFKKPFDEEYSVYADRIRNSNSVLLNFRVGGDYKELGWVLDFDYQKKAMEYIVQHVENPKFFVFADDISYVKNNFKSDYELEFVDLGKDNPDKIYFDLELMKLFKHSIISNSTFSWWAAWLNENPNKIVVAPEPWLFNKSDIVPDEWVKLEAKKVPSANPLKV